MMMRILMLIYCIWRFGAGNAIPTAIDSSTCRPNNINPKVVIIGAGASGIACATKLLELGFENVQIIEAEPRIGGRVYTIPFGANVLDIGAQYCHGKKDNVVYELASKHNLLEHYENEEDYKCIRSNREIVPVAIESRLKEIVFAEHFDGLDSYNGSLGSYMKNNFYNKLKNSKYSDIDEKIAREFYENVQRMQCSSGAADSLDQISARSFAEYFECEGDQALNWKDKGFKEFLRLLLKSDELGTELGVLDKRVTLSKTVTKINWNSDKSNVEIICKDGEAIEADHVIVTVSLGVLKEQHASLFEPALPAEKIHAIDVLSIGTVNKVILEFPKPFWPVNWPGFSTLWRDEDLAEISGTSRAWILDICNFHPVSHQPNILLGWVVGPGARHMETLPTEEVRSGVMFLLKKFLSWEIPDPVRFKSSAWFSNVNFRGTWSYHSMNSEEGGKSTSDLAKPLTAKADACNNPIVQFAGEATNSYKYGTVNGATETGWREARVLGELYGKFQREPKIKE